ncbi:MAG TPA: AI-2E family transporter [Blastocatellia bacterium]|nr:AI-2E family transporter [Blastocatellia bacterium]
MVKKRVTIIFLSAMTLAALYACYRLFQPFLEPLLSAAVIAVVFYPVHAQIQHRLRSPSLAALLSTTIVVLLLVVPAVAVILAVKGEVTDLYNLINEKTTESGGFSPYVGHLIERPMQWIGRYVDLSQVDLRAWVLGRLRELSAVLVAQGWMIVGGLTSFILNSVIAIFTLFFLFREGRSMRRRLAALLPLSAEQVEKLFGGIENTIIGTVYGGLVVAAVQGALTGLALWVFGVPSPVLWGVVAAFFALLPVVGTAAVWAPAAIYLLATGSWIKAIILVIWGAFVVGTIDNVLRPYLISGRVQMHTLLIFFSVFGGVNVFGFLGLFIGPVILAVTITLLSMLRDESRSWNSYWREEAPAVAPSGELEPPTE